MTIPKGYELEGRPVDRIKGYRPQRYPLAHAQCCALAWST